MAVYKRGEIYHYEFEHRGFRLRGSTGCTSKREAQEFERQKRQEAAKEAERREALGRAPSTWGAIASRYWTEHGRHHSRTTHTLTSLEWLTREIGEATPLHEVNGSVIARMVAKRRGDGVGPATVNRTVTEPLRRVLKRAALWGEHLPPIEWKRHLLSEPRERVRELRAEEEAALFEALRPDYHPIVRFALLTGARLAECVSLTWEDVHWGERLIWLYGKGRKRASIPLPPIVRELLWPLRGQHPRAVFSFVVQHKSGDARLGERRPVAYEGLKTEWRRAVTRAGLKDLHFHDLRHTCASRLLRSTGNLNVVRRLLRHEDIASTMRYAHTTNEDVLAAMETMASQRVPTNAPHNASA
jgi:integrase